MARMAVAAIGTLAVLVTAACSSNSSGTSGGSASGNATASSGSSAAPATSSGAGSGGASSSASAGSQSAAASASGSATGGSAASQSGGSASSGGAAPSATGAQSTSTTYPTVTNKPPSGASLSILFGSSGSAETNALNAAAQNWAKQTGNKVTVTPASNLSQQLAQGFSSNTPPDLFYTDAGLLGTYAKAGDLWAYGSQLPNKADFYPSLVNAFTYNGQLMCAPKDQSTLALFINTDDWKAAGLTDADIPTTWDQLASVAKKLTTDGRVGLSMSATRDRIDAFMVQAGGYLVSSDGKTATANSDANVQALTYIKSLLTAGSMKWASDLNTSWGGEAFGTNKAAMTIEGPWLLGSMTSDYPKINYKVVELPAGPKGKGTLVFTNCWGIAAASKNQQAALSLVEFLTDPGTEMTFAKAFGVIPSVETAQSEYLKEFPDNAPFINGIAYAKGVVNAPNTTDVLSNFDQLIPTLATADPKSILDQVQQNLSAALSGS